MDEQAIDNMYYFVYKLSPGLLLPNELRERTVLFKWSDIRANLIEAEDCRGETFDTWAKLAVCPDSSIDWTKWGPFTFAYDDNNRATSISYMNRPGKQIAQYIHIDQSDYAAYDLHCVTLARIQCNQAKFRLLDFFPEHDLARKNLFDKKGRLMKLTVGEARTLVHGAPAPVAETPPPQLVAVSPVVEDQTREAALDQAQAALAGRPRLKRSRVMNFNNM